MPYSKKAIWAVWLLWSIDAHAASKIADQKATLTNACDANAEYPCSVGGKLSDVSESLSAGKAKFDSPFQIDQLNPKKASDIRTYIYHVDCTLRMKCALSITKSPTPSPSCAANCKEAPPAAQCPEKSSAEIEVMRPASSKWNIEAGKSLPRDLTDTVKMNACTLKLQTLHKLALEACNAKAVENFGKMNMPVAIADCVPQ